MKNITKEQIDDVVMKAETRVTENVAQYIHENDGVFMKDINNDGEFDMNSSYITALNIILQMSIDTIKLSLYELLCDE